jgi:hypothetical protein
VIRATRTPTPPPSLAAAKRHNGGDVVEALLRDFRDKCYLCECPIKAREQCVDHRRSQAEFPELKYTLFPSCRDCNERRPRSYPRAGLLDPCSDDVEARLHQTLRPDERGVGEVPHFAAVDPADLTAAATARELDHLHNDAAVKAADLRAAIQQRIDEVLADRLAFAAHGATTRGPVRAAWEAPLRHGFSRRAPFTALVRTRLGEGFAHLFD